MGDTFKNCDFLTSVTFQGSSIKFSRAFIDSGPSFIGDFESKYLAKDDGPGTYTRFDGGSTWRKLPGSTGNAPQQQTEQAVIQQQIIMQQPTVQSEITGTNNMVESASVPENMVRINGGTFLMESPANEHERLNSEGPYHQVTVSSFYEERQSQLEVSRLMRMVYTICMEMYGNSAGIGTEITQVDRRLIPMRQLPALTGWYVVGVGATAARTCVPRVGTATIRTTEATVTASVWCAPEF